MGPEILRLSALGGLLGLDGTSVGQFMFSRPLVAGALTGWVLGDVQIGLAVGTVLELYLLVSFPTGGARFPEGSTATVVAVGTAVALGHGGGVPLGVALGLLWGQLGGTSITLLRRLNTRLVPGPEADAAPRILALVHLTTILLDFLRAALVTGIGVWLGRVVVAPLAEAWPLAREPSIALVSIGGLVSAGVLLNDLGGIRARRAWFLSGLLLGALVPRLI